MCVLCDLNKNITRNMFENVVVQRGAMRILALVPEASGVPELRLYENRFLTITVWSIVQVYHLTA